METLEYATVSKRTHETVSTRQGHKVDRHTNYINGGTYIRLEFTDEHRKRSFSFEDPSMRCECSVMMSHKDDKGDFHAACISLNDLELAELHRQIGERLARRAEDVSTDKFVKFIPGRAAA